MSSAGHILDMINRIKQNRVSRRKKFKGDNRDSIYSEKFDQETAYDFPEASPNELKALKLKIRQRTRTNNRRSVVLLLFSIAVVTLGFWAIMAFVNI